MNKYIKKIVSRNLFLVIILPLAFVAGTYSADILFNWIEDKEGVFVEKIIDRNSLDHELTSRLIKSDVRDIFALNIFAYDFEAIGRAEAAAQRIDAQLALKKLFKQITYGINEGDHRGRWLAVQKFVSLAVRHPPLTQPMYEDKTMVTHPIVLLLLGEARCGHVARLIVDIALANGYEARLVQLAAHLVAEVKYQNKWHWIDADADFPESVIEGFLDIPSVEDLSHSPYLLDNLPARGWQWSRRDQRTTENVSLPLATYYPAELRTSSIYFGDEIFKNHFSGDVRSPRKGLQYYYKVGNPSDWQKDIYYGWNNLRMEEIDIGRVKVEFHPSKPNVLVDSIVYPAKDVAVVRIRFFPVTMPLLVLSGGDLYAQAKLINSYEVRVSKKSRGWNYDYRNYAYMPKRGDGDVLVTRNIQNYGDSLGVDVEVQADPHEIFIEVIPLIDNSFTNQQVFTWPSNELSVQIYPVKIKRFEDK